MLGQKLMEDVLFRSVNKDGILFSLEADPELCTG